MPIVPSLVGLALALAVGLLHLTHWTKTHGGLGPFWGGELPWWTTALVVLLYVRIVERRPFASLGFRSPGAWDIGWAVVLAIGSLVGMMAISSFVFPVFGLHQNAAAYYEIVKAPLSHRLLLVTRAAVCEEILFRGYVLERIEGMSGSAWVGALTSWALFTYAHLASWGAAQLIMAGFAGAVLTILYVWRRNLWSNIVTHWLVDGVGFVLIPLLRFHH